MSVQSETQLRSKEGTTYYQLEDFSYIGNSSMQKELSPLGLHSYFRGKRVMCEVIHTGGSQRTQEKPHKEIGGLEYWGKAYVVSIQSMSNIEGLY